MEEIFERLTKEVLKGRIKDSFLAIYFTMASIIQGVALGILAFNTFGYINDPQYNNLWITFLPYTIISFFIIIIITYEFNWSLEVLRWSPRIWDTIVHFTLGFSEIAPMFFFTNPKIWWLLTSVFCFVGTLALLNTFCHCKKDMFEKNETYRRVKNELLGSIIIAILAAFFCILVYSFSSNDVLYSNKGILFRRYISFVKHILSL